MFLSCKTRKINHAKISAFTVWVTWSLSENDIYVLLSCWYQGFSHYTCTAFIRLSFVCSCEILIFAFYIFLPASIQALFFFCLHVLKDSPICTSICHFNFFCVCVPVTVILLKFKQIIDQILPVYGFVSDKNRCKY